MTKHTPGTWIVDFYTDSGGFDIYTSTAPTQTICRRGPWDHNKKESEANARLIAAAPELLEALQRSLATLELATCSTGYCCCGSLIESHGIYDGHGPVDEGDYHQSKTIEAARAAIAKSTGGSQ